LIRGDELVPFVGDRYDIGRALQRPDEQVALTPVGEQRYCNRVVGMTPSGEVDSCAPPDVECNTLCTNIAASLHTFISTPRILIDCGSANSGSAGNRL